MYTPAYIEIYPQFVPWEIEWKMILSNVLYAKKKTNKLKQTKAQKHPPKNEKQ